ncbi:MAG: endonuclease domain-containing protein [Myxococcota bacterium]|nr:endonuclease domain-containing protein [Myxococcota bacterium]
MAGKSRTHRTSDRGTIAFARELRKHLTTAEQLLWARLRKKSLLGLRFRRQHPIGPFIADFYCAEAGLVIEVDGGIHHKQEQQKRDKLRDQAISEHGLATLRFDNRDIEAELDRVVETIEKKLIERVQTQKVLKTPTKNHP